MSKTAPVDWVGGKCPICNKPSVYEARPFCSPRCKVADLGNWASGAYAIPVVESEEDSDQYETIFEDEK